MHNLFVFLPLCPLVRTHSPHARAHTRLPVGRICAAPSTLVSSPRRSFSTALGSSVSNNILLRRLVDGRMAQGQ